MIHHQLHVVEGMRTQTSLSDESRFQHELYEDAKTRSKGYAANSVRNANRRELAHECAKEGDIVVAEKRAEKRCGEKGDGGEPPDRPCCAIFS